MQRLTLYPYFHPTTVVLVDDNEPFLHSLALEMPATMAFHGFTSPEEALEFVNAPSTLPPLAERCFSLERSDDNQALINLDLGMIGQEINHLERFRRVSVALVDYAMPSLDGLEFCQQMTDPHARRAMFTGVADEKVAVEAFNAGLIHRYISKQQATAAEAVVAFVAELEREYFHRCVQRLAAALTLTPPGFLTDPAIAVNVGRLLQDEGVVEYYLVSDPPGFLMLRADGSALRLVLLDEAAHARQIELVRRFGAPADIRRGIERGGLVGLFDGESPADYFGDETYPWAEQVVPATQLPGAEGWVAAIARDAVTDVDFDPAATSYDAYLAQLPPR